MTMLSPCIDGAVATLTMDVQEDETLAEGYKLKLNSYDLGVDIELADAVQRLNSRGVKLAREARESASREVLIAGSIGPLGLGVQSRHPSPDEILDVFHEQALALEERGVDFYILETFSYIEEILLAIDAIRSFSGLPIVAQLTYTEEGTTHGDLRPADAAAQLKAKNVQVIGANCTLGPQPLLKILRELTAIDDLRVSGMPNAGLPKREGDRIVYPKSSPEYFALFAREAAALGADAVFTVERRVSGPMCVEPVLAQQQSIGVEPAGKRASGRDNVCIGDAEHGGDRAVPGDDVGNEVPVVSHVACCGQSSLKALRLAVGRGRVAR